MSNCEHKWKTLDTWYGYMMKGRVQWCRHCGAYRRQAKRTDEHRYETFDGPNYPDRVRNKPNMAPKRTHIAVSDNICAIGKEADV
jgi:hypothetical protein